MDVLKLRAVILLRNEGRDLRRSMPDGIAYGGFPGEATLDNLSRDPASLFRHPDA